MIKISKEVLNFELPIEFELEENEDFLYLIHKGEKVAVFSTSGATPEAILDAVERIKREKNGG